MKGNSTEKLQIAGITEGVNGGHGEKFQRKAEAAIVALLVQPTMPKAAKAAGVSQVTLWRWLKREDFQERYREAQKRVFDGALASLQGASSAAVDCLSRNLTCGNPASEIAAARTILDFTTRARELIELTEKVSMLERIITRRER